MGIRSDTSSDRPLLSGLGEGFGVGIIRSEVGVVKRIGGAGLILGAALMMLLSAPLLCADNDELRDQVRRRQRVIDTELRVLQQQARAAEFGSQLYWQLRRSISALERERSSLRSLESALWRGNPQEIARRQADFLRAHEESLYRGQNLVETRARELPFGSRSWYDYRRLATSWQQQRRAAEPFGPEYRRALEAQIRLLEGQRSRLEFGSQQWYAVNRQITALRQALRSAR